MTVVAQVKPHGPASMFALIADFLDKAGFRAAADSVRAQAAEKDVANEADMLKHLRDFVDGATLILTDSEAGERQARNSIAGEALREVEQQASQLIDGLLRRLVAGGQSFSDEKLNSSIEGVLGNDVFSKLLAMDAPMDKCPATPDGASDADVQKYWEQIQRESLADGTLAKLGAGDVVASTEGCAVVFVPAADQQQQQQQALAQPLPQESGPSAHYVPKKPRGSAEEDWDAADEYHDDDDPGYRIRDIYETELLAELSAKMAQGRVFGAAGDASVNSTRELPPGEVGDEPAGASHAGAPPPSPTVVWPGERAGSGSGCGSGGGGDGGHEPVSASRQDDEAYPASYPPSPTLGGEAGASVSTAPVAGAADNLLASEAAATQPASDAASAAAEDAAEQQHLGRRKQRHGRNVKYATSGDPFYPVELDGVVYDSFGLRVVYERDKTGFEESKEFPIRMNSIVAARYQILEYLGSAAFSRAVQCLDLESNKMVCMKIIKNEKDFFDQSLDEIKLLKYINVNGDVDENCVLRLYDYFYHKEHLIIITELLRDNLYEFSKFNRESGDDPYFTLGRLQKIAKQVLTALEYVHSLRLIHCDLKPENILIRSYCRCEVKVIDFGSSCFVDDHLTSYVQSRSYRAPEVMLGLPYDQKIDLWSLGCILAELWTGYVLFQNDSVQSLLARILGIIGDFPYHLMTRGRYVPQYFTQEGQLYQELDGPACPERGRRLHLLVPKRTSLRQRMRTDSEEFLDFLEQLLQLDPAKRPTATEALQHPWITKCKYPDGLP